MPGFESFFFIFTRILNLYCRSGVTAATLRIENNAAFVGKRQWRLFINLENSYFWIDISHLYRIVV